MIAEEYAHQHAYGRRLPADLIENGPAKTVIEQRNADQDADAGLPHAGKNIGPLEAVQDRHRRAKGKRQQDAGHRGIGMVEGEEKQKVVGVVEEVKLDHALQVRRQVAVREHHPFGIARRARGIQDRGQVACRRRRRDRGIVMCRNHVMEWHAVAGIEGDDDERTVFGQLLTARVGYKDRLCLGARQQERDLLVRELGIQRHDDRTVSDDGQIRDHPLGPVLGKKGNPVSLVDPVFRKRAGNRCHAPDKVAVRVLLIPVTRFYLDGDLVGISRCRFLHSGQEHVMPRRGI